MYALLFIDLGEGETSEVYEVLLTVLILGGIHSPVLDQLLRYIILLQMKKMTSIVEDCARGTWLLLTSQHGCVFIQLLVLVLT